VEREIFSLDALLRAAYKFTDRCHVFLQSGERGEWLAVMRPKAAMDPDHLVGDFANELVDQQLRARLETQFGDMRTLIVAQAFSEGNLLDPAQVEGDVYTYPQSIGNSR